MAKKRASALRSGTRTIPVGHRRVVRREERVGPTPETLAKLRPWPINYLVAEERLSVDYFEASIEICQAFKFITRIVGYKPLDLERIAGGHGGIGERGERIFEVYRRWGNAVQGIDPKAALLLDDDTARVRRQSLAAAAALLYARHRVRPHEIVEMIEDDGRCWLDAEVALLNQACGLWRRMQEVYDGERQAERNAKSERHTIMTEQAVLDHDKTCAPV